MKTEQEIQNRVREIIPYLTNIEGGDPKFKDLVVQVDNATIDSDQLAKMEQLGYVIDSINTNVPDKLAALQGYIYLWKHSSGRKRFCVNTVKSSRPKMDDEAEVILANCLEDPSHPFFMVTSPSWFLSIAAMNTEKWTAFKQDAPAGEVMKRIKSPFSLRQQHNLWAMKRGPEEYQAKCRTGFGIVFYNTNYQKVFTVIGLYGGIITEVESFSSYRKARTYAEELAERWDCQEDDDQKDWWHDGQHENDVGIRATILDEEVEL